MRIIFLLWLLSLALSGFSQGVVSYEDKSTNQTEIESDDFDIIFYQDMEDTPVGALSKEQWVLDWQNPDYANGVYTGDPSIIEDSNIAERKSRVMR